MKIDRKFLLIILLVILIGVSCKDETDGKYYQEALNWITTSSELKQSIAETFGLVIHTEGPLRFAVFDSLTPLSVSDYFAEDSCSLIVDRKIIDEIREKERSFRRYLLTRYYPSFSSLWNDTAKLVVTFGFVYQNKMVARIYERHEYPNDELWTKNDSLITGITIPSQSGKKNLREISWFSDCIQITFCFDGEVKVKNAIIHPLWQ